MNPTKVSPNVARKFTPGAKYWLRESDAYVMPRDISRYEAPEGFIPVVAADETTLNHDNSGLETVPRNIDPTDINHVGAAVSYEGSQTVEGRDTQARPMPVSLPNAMHDHQTRDRAEQAMQQLGTPSQHTASLAAAAAAAAAESAGSGNDSDVGSQEPQTDENLTARQKRKQIEQQTA